MSGWNVIIGLAVCVALGLAGYFVAPKGPNQTVWRSSVLLTIASCYLMWAITYLSQLHPLISPRTQTLREGYA